MSKQRPKSSKSRKQSAKLRQLLEQMVVPAFDEHADEPLLEPGAFDLVDHATGVGMNGVVCGGNLFRVSAVALDDQRALLRIDTLAGYLLDEVAGRSLVVATLLEPTPFHLRGEFELGSEGRLSVGCDVVVRDDEDESLVRRRIDELVQLSRDLDWYFPLRMPRRLRWFDVHDPDLELSFDEWPSGELAEFLEHGMQAPQAERTPLTLLRIAQGLSRWKEVLQLLREHRHALPAQVHAPLKVMACRQLGRWLPAVRAAREGRINKGRYPGAPWRSPSYLHALIEGGDEVGALCMLGKPAPDEPGFYDWLRGLALYRAGDPEGAEKAFDRYFARWPGDVVGRWAASTLGDGEAD